MIEFKRYPHVGDLIQHYVKETDNTEITALLENGVRTKEEAYLYSKFILSLIDCMAKDMQNGVSVLGSTDNTSMIPDIDYEVSLYLANKGMEEVWDEVCNEDQP